MYHVHRVIHEKCEITCNGFHEIYMNSENDDGSAVAGRMTILKSRDVQFAPRFPHICRAIRDIKQRNGRDTMCETVKNYAKEYAKEYAEEKIIQIAKNMIRNGFSVASISENTGLSPELIAGLMKE